MSYILTCENCECRCIEMVEQNSELIAKGVGEIYTGTVVLGQIRNKDVNTKSLGNTETVLSESIKKFLFLKTNEELCYFEFDESELKNGEKEIKMQVQSDSSVIHYIIVCYSLFSYEGAAYLLPNLEELKRWAKELNICTYEVLDSVGKLISVEYFSE